jgi:flavin reductase (DIM6/NTAB) family NADH-FMN oxidoreductase RutF
MDYWKIFAKRNVILVTTRDENSGKENIMPARWCTRCSTEPSLIAISIGLDRYTHELLEKNKYFGISIPNENFDYKFIGSHSGRDIDKFRESKIEKMYGKYGTPFAKDTLLDIELEKYSSFKTGDHTFFVGKVLEVFGSSSGKIRMFGYLDDGVTIENFIDEIERKK